MTDYYAHKDDLDSSFQLYVKPFYQQSKGSARYFLPNNKCSIVLAEDGTGDVNSLWLNLIAPVGSSYHSKVCFDPKRKAYGAVITCYADLCPWVDGLWASLNTAIIGVEHDLNIKETNSQADGTISGFSNFCQALNNNVFTFGKMSCCSMKKHGLDDIQLKLGYDFVDSDCGRLALFGVLAIPTGDDSKARYLFEPLVGSKNVGLGFGFNGDYLLSENSCREWALLGDFKYSYAFSAHEERSFDLCLNGDWSRYLQVVQEDARLVPSPAINALTLPVDVTPRGTIDVWAAIHLEQNCWNYEVGYNLWWRQAEEISLKSNSCDTSCKTNVDVNASIGGIFDIAGFCSPATITTASTATIAQSVASSSNPVTSDAVFTPTTLQDISVSSGAHPNALSNKLYASIGYVPGEETCLPSVSVLGSYEIAHNQNALDQWAIWANIAFNF
jgi:hypothetical protein